MSLRLFVLATLLVGCAPAGPGTFVGTLEGSNAYLALSTDGEHALAYVCDGVTDSTSPHIATWFSGAVTAGQIEIVQASGRLSLTVSGDQVFGSVDLGGAGHLHDITGARAEGVAGLYRGEANDLIGGWTVLADGSQRGGVGGINQKTGIAPTLDPTVLQVRLSPTLIMQVSKVGFTPVPIP